MIGDQSSQLAARDAHLARVGGCVRPDHRRRIPLRFSGLILALVMVLVPGPAYAYTLIQYALKTPAAEDQWVYSASGSIVGGKVALGTTSPPGTRVRVQTYASQYAGVIYQTEGVGTVSFTHGPVNNVNSRCSWTYINGPVSGSIPINCWRYRP